MKVILHMGQGKTGNSSLQESMTQAAGSLRGKGVLYPPMTPGKPHHHLIPALCGQVGRAPPWLLEPFGGEEGATRVFREEWDKDCQVLRDEQVKMLILSSEFLIHKTDGQGKLALAEHLKRISEDIVRSFISGIPSITFGPVCSSG